MILVFHYKIITRNFVNSNHNFKFNLILASSNKYVKIISMLYVLVR
jgi:hypothetical protein